MTPLAAYFKQSQRAGKITPGKNDCLLWVSDWAVLRGHPDPAAPYRGRYRSWRGARACVDAGGGMLAVARAGAARAGLVEIAPDDARPGDIGLGFPDGPSNWPDEPMALIRAGGFWAAYTRNLGVVIGRPLSMLAAWRI